MVKHKRRKIDREKIFSIISSHWPINVSEVADKLGILTKDENENKIVLNGIRYHFDLLHRQGKIRLKKIGRNLVAWPSEIERLRVIHDLIRGL